MATGLQISLLYRKTSTRLKMPSMWVFIALLLSLACSTALSQDAPLSCNSLYTPAQREMCRDIPDLLRILEGAEQQALIECERVFFNQSWNCSDFSVIKPSVVMQYATKEAAFMFSIMSASIAHVTSWLCASDEEHSLPCGCSNESTIFPIPNPETVIMEGCSYDIDYGMKLSKQFMDSFDIFTSDLEKFSVHNNRVGRLVLEDFTDIVCICHGVSSGCTLQTCRVELEHFAAITKHLFDLYKKSCKVNSNGKFGDDHAYESECGLLDKTDLIYFVDSPDYCIKNPSKGSPGVKGRSCNPHIKGEGSCSQTCCGRGYEPVTEEFVDSCLCHFKWCCEVICDTCRWEETRYFCL